MSFTPYVPDPQLDLVLERQTDLSVATVWRALTEPDLLCQWFTPQPWSTARVELEPYPGGKFLSVMRSPDGEEFENVGCYLEVVEQQRLVWTAALGPGYRPQQSDMPFTAVIELTHTASGGTTYRAIAVHQQAEHTEAHKQMGFHEGWGAAFDQLVALIS